VTSLAQDPGKQHTSLERVSSQQIGACVPPRRESPATVTHPLFLIAFVVIWGVDRAALLGSSVSPDVKGLSSSVCREAERFCKGTSGFWGSLFLLMVLAVASSVLLHYFLPSLLRVPVGEFLTVWPQSVGPLQTALGTSCLSPSQPP